MQQRDILLDQIELAGRVIGKAIALYFDLKSSNDINQAIQETKITLQTQIDLDIDAMLGFRNVSQLQANLTNRYLNADHLDLLSQFLFDVGSELRQSQP